MSFVNYIRAFGSVIDLAPAPSHCMPPLDGVIEKVMARLEAMMSRPKEQSVFTSDEKRYLGTATQQVDDEAVQGEPSSSTVIESSSIYVGGPDGTRFELDLTKDLEPQFWDAIRAMQASNPLLTLTHQRSQVGRDEAEA